MLRRLFLAFIACVAVTACARAPQQQECPVIIGFGNYEYTGPQVISSSSTPGFLSDPAFLFDGQPSTLTRIQWGDGSQTTSSFTGIEFLFSATDPPTPADYGLVAILNTSLPAGLVFELRSGTTGGSPLASGKMLDNGNGTTSGWLIFPVTTNGANLSVIMFRNNVGGSHVIAPSAEFTVGEIFVGDTVTLGLKRDVKDATVNPQKARLSSAGVQWTVLPPEVRSFVANLSPLTQKQAYVGENGNISIKALISTLYTTSVFAYVPFLYYDQSYYGKVASPTQYAHDLIAQTAYLAALSQPPTITQNGDMFYDVTLIGQESI